MKFFPLLLASLLLLPGALQAGSYARISQRSGDLPAEQVIDEQPGGQARSVVTRPEVTWVELPEPHVVTNQVAYISASVSNHVMRLNGITGAEDQQSDPLELEGRFSGSFQFTGVTSRLYVKYRVQRLEVSEMQTLRKTTSPPPVVQNNLVASIRHNLTDHPLRPPCDAVAAGCDWQVPGAFQTIAIDTRGNTALECIADGRYFRGSQNVILSSAGNTGTESFEETPCSSLYSLVSSQRIQVSPTSAYLEESRDESLTETLETGWIRVDPGLETTFTLSARLMRSVGTANELSASILFDDTLTLSLLLATDNALDPQAAGGFWHAAPPAGLPVIFTTVTAAELVSPGHHREFVHTVSGSFESPAGEILQHTQQLTSIWSGAPTPTGEHRSTRTDVHTHMVDQEWVTNTSSNTLFASTASPEMPFTGTNQFNQVELGTDPSPLTNRVFQSRYSLSRDWMEIDTLAALDPENPLSAHTFSGSEHATFRFNLSEPSWLVLNARYSAGALAVRLSEDDVDLLSDSRHEWKEHVHLLPGEYVLTLQAQSGLRLAESALLIAINPLCFTGIAPTAGGVELHLDRLLVGEEVVLEALEAGAESAAVEVARFVPTQSTHRVTWPVPPGDAPLLFRLRQLRETPPE